MVKPIATVEVVPQLPPRLERLRELAYNLRWSWDHDAIDLFRRLDRDLWEATNHNPVWMLGLIRQYQLEAAADDEAFMAHYRRVCDSFDRYMAQKSTWFQKNYGDEWEQKPFIAYFSAEFGITECLQNYSGGLGVLSGDHLKAASDLGIPLVVVGLLYQEGYFQQYLNVDGWQQEEYPINDFFNQPIQMARDEDDNPLKVRVPYPGREVVAQVWKAQVGRVPLILLDTNLPENNEADRDITDRLYGGDNDMRIRQEIMMGIGGLRALDALGIRPVVCHMNEGHSAFLALERIRLLMKEHGLSFEEAREIASAGNVFTTHTPVPAGLERFPFDLMWRYFSGYASELGLSWDEFCDLGREDVGGYEVFSLPVLALRLSAFANGVSRLHGKVSRSMWHYLWPGVPDDEVPITHITNGVHTLSWISHEMATLFDRYLDPHWRDDPSNPDIWWDVERIPDSELWRTHERRRERLVAFARQRLRSQLEARGAPATEIEQASEVLNPDALTIGFARRFATYKRATLLFKDPERLAKILNDPERPVQMLFAGKAHPHDDAGKDLIRTIVHFANRPEFRNSIVFLENYDMTIARYLVQGVDVWLNTPRRPREASGTSGMKVVYNGGLNASILDGWWDEAYDPSVGWAIGAGEEYNDQEMQDYIESQALYNLLEQDIIPLFYTRGRDGIPRGWLERMKNSLRKLAPFFNTHRMVRQYTEEFYLPAARRYKALTEPNMERGKALSAWLDKVRREWPSVSIKRVEVQNGSRIKVGGKLKVRTWVELGQLAPDDVAVELYFGSLDTKGLIVNAEVAPMKPTGERQNGAYEFVATVSCNTSGERGIAVRVLPSHPDMAQRFLPGLIRWSEPE